MQKGFAPLRIYTITFELVNAFNVSYYIYLTIGTLEKLETSAYYIRLGTRIYILIRYVIYFRSNTLYQSLNHYN